MKTNSPNKVVDFYSRNKNRRTATYKLNPDENVDEVKGLIDYYFYDRDLLTEFDGVETARQQTERGELENRTIKVYIIIGRR